MFVESCDMNSQAGSYQLSCLQKKKNPNWVIRISLLVLRFESVSSSFKEQHCKQRAKRSIHGSLIHVFEYPNKGLQ